ncbi:MBL fold metallo-hydrolase [Marinicella litoralis]|uniref:Beta-lactamase family protein n=1 Tax=Marinicella litoralis TaxID=644220 RepID=A0A4R6XTG5_9GAMM|nr:MBL fold metallo-hydrolase [Marinicella litoralis]TDR23255.1 beta-lactamase family protein [Marinicella litoralis]
MKNLLSIILILLSGVVDSHEVVKPAIAVRSVGALTGEVTYLGNTGLMVSHGDQQVLFDPFFHRHFNHYQLVPADIKSAIFAKKPPYDSIEMIFISHAHGDHFDAKDVLEYLKLNPVTQLVAPSQAVDQLKVLSGYQAIKKQVVGLELNYGDQPIEMTFVGIDVGAVRIPHAGWPGRADVSNLVYRVTLNKQVTVMHMGDADPDDLHFKPWANYWAQKVTHNAFPPYWFLTHSVGQQILAERINSLHHTGIHVPVVVPDQLQYSGEDYFSVPGKTIKLKQIKNTLTK